jgi:SAM-dependent methyltransferase
VNANDDAEHEALTTDAGRSVLDQAAMVPEPGPSDVARWRRLARAEVVAGACRIAQARRKAAGKLPGPVDRMWLDPVGVEQATSGTVARHKAARFAEAGASVVADLCSGIGGDALALARVVPAVIAVDHDRAMARRLAWNAKTLGLNGNVRVVRGDAARPPVPPSSFMHIDPDRRPVEARDRSHRATGLDGYRPAVPELVRLLRSSAGAAVKLGPASRFLTLADLIPNREVELISLDGECKEAAIWSGSLARCRARATLLPQGATWTDRDADPRRRASVSDRTRRFVLEPDASLVRSGLLDGFAARLGLPRLMAGLDWLTADDAPGSPFLTAFEVEDEFPLDRKTLRAIVADRGLGALEIKVRGVDLVPETLRRELRPRTGGRPATWLIAGGGREGGGARAILAHRV